MQQIGLDFYQADRLSLPSFDTGAFSSNFGSFSSRVVLDAILRQVQIEGTYERDHVVVTEIDPQTIRVNFIGVETRDFNTADVDSLRFWGRNGDDRFDNRTQIAASAFGHNGNDTLIGGTNNDALNGGAGLDILYGKGGDDEIRGTGGNDTIFGGGGNDYLVGANGDDYIDGGSGYDLISGNAGNDHLLGSTQNDRIWGGFGNDRIDGGNGNDRIFGNDNYDTLFGGDGADLIRGGEHADTIEGGNGSDRLFGESGNDTIRATTGSNYINGGAGHDRLYGGQHRDEIDGGIGSDIIYGGRGDDLIRGNEGTDKIYGYAGNDMLYGGFHADLIDGGSGSDRLFGEHGNDELLGRAGFDRLDGGSGADSLMGGQGGQRDTLVGGTGADKLIYFSSDVLIGSNASDLRVRLHDKSSSWTDSEISVINRALSMLHNATGNSRLVQDAITGKDLLFEKVDQLPDGSIAVNRLSSTTVNNVTTYHRVIQFSDWNENNARRQDRQAYVFIHEIAHNWDDDFELNAAAGVSTLDRYRFTAISSWRSTYPGSSDFRRSGDGNWWYHNTAQFARSYGNTNPYEDWSTVWEYYFNSSNASPPSNTNLGRKLAELQRFFDKLS